MDKATTIVLGLTALAGAALLLFLWQGRKEWLKAMHELAARRGWLFEETQSQGGKPARLALRPPEGDWQLTVLRGESDLGEDIRTTSFTTPSVRHDGLIVAGPPLPPGQATMAAGLLGLLSGPFGQKALAAMIGADLAPLATNLAPERSFEPAVILTDSPLPAALEARLRAATQTLAGWTPREAGENGRPVLILSAGGLRLRLRHALKVPADLEAFADLGFKLAADLDAAVKG